MSTISPHTQLMIIKITCYATKTSQNIQIMYLIIHLWFCGLKFYKQSSTHFIHIPNCFKYKCVSVSTHNTYFWNCKNQSYFKLFLYKQVIFLSCSCYIWPVLPHYTMWPFFFQTKWRWHTRYYIVIGKTPPSLRN